MNRILRTSTIFVLAASLALAVAGCSEGGSSSSYETKTSDVAASKSLIETINGADSIKLKKAAISWGDDWKISVGGEEIAEVKGLPIYLIGDTYSMYDNDGHLVGSEQEEWKFITSSAGVYDYNNDEIGSIKQDITLFLHRFSIFEKDKQVGTTEQNFDISIDASVKDMDGTENWHVDSKVFTFGAELTLTRKHDDPKVSGMNAVWTALILNEMSEAEAQKNSD